MAWCLPVLIASVHSPQRASPLCGRVKAAAVGAAARARRHGELTDWLPAEGNSLFVFQWGWGGCFDEQNLTYLRAADTTHTNRASRNNGRFRLIITVLFISLASKICSDSDVKKSLHWLPWVSDLCHWPDQGRSYFIAGGAWPSVIVNEWQTTLMSPFIYPFSTILGSLSSVYIIWMIFSNPVERRENLTSCSCTDIFEIGRVNVWLSSGRGWEREMSENVRAEKRGLGKSWFRGFKSKDTEICKSLTCQCG